MLDRQNNAAIQSLLKAEVKIILIDRTCPGLTLDIIKDNNEYGAYELTKLLLKRGHTKIAFLRGATGSTASIEREKGWRDALKEEGLPAHDEWIYTTGASGEKVREAIASILSLEERVRPTALFACNSLIARQVMMRLNELSIETPKQMALVCYGLEEFKTLYRPSVTCVVQHPDYVGYLSAKLMVERLEEDGEETPKEIILAPDVFEGQST